MKNDVMVGSTHSPLTVSSPSLLSHLVQRPCLPPVIPIEVRSDKLTIP